MDVNNRLKPFENCPALDGYHCQTNSLAKIFHHYGCPLSEEMLLGLGAGMSFFYWHQKGTAPFVGGRGNLKNFFTDIGKRTGVKIEVETTTSAKKAESILLEKMGKREPVMLYGDMGFLPWFEFPEEYHFGGHSFVVCGYDGKDNLLASDMDPKVAGLKKGFYAPITLEQLSKARGSTYKPFPPKNAALKFDFAGFHHPQREEILESLKDAADSMLNPPISNAGIKGIRRTAGELKNWPQIFSGRDLRINLFSI